MTEDIPLALRNDNPKMTTDKLHEGGHATVSIAIVANSSTFMDIVLQTPGKELDLDLCQAEVSGHHSAVSCLEVSEPMLTAQGITPSGKATVSCDDETSLNGL